MIIQISLNQLLVSSGLIIILLTIFQFLSSLWIKIRLEESIKNEYEKEIHDYDFSILQREQAVKIATLLAKWIKFGEDSDLLLTMEEKRNHFEELNKMTLELAIWIPDELIVKKLMSCLAHDTKAPNIREIVIDVRKLVQKKENLSLKLEDVVIFINR